MSKLIPDYVFDSIYDITPEVLTAHGVRGVLVDLDGTMASHKAALPPDTLHTFVDRLKNAGIAVLVFSNNHPERVGKFCEPLGVGYISHAGKPFSRGFRKAANRLGLSMREIAVIGDQIFTDCLAAHRAGVDCYLVKPIKSKETFFFRLKRAFEKPFLSIYRRRRIKSKGCN